MRMAPRWRRRWVAIGGATALVATAVWAAVALAAPAGIGVTSPSGAPHVSWSENGTAATSYDVERASGVCAGTADADFALVASSTATSFTDTTLTGPDATYCYRVTGHYDAATTATSGLAQTIFDATAPAPPMFASPASGATVHAPLTVAASSSDSSGVALKSVTLSADGVPTPLVVAAGNSASIQWAPPDGHYTLRAIAVDRADNSSMTAIPITVDSTPPASFSIFAPSPVVGSPTLSWPSSDPSSTYTATRDGVAVGAVSSPWTDLNPGTGTHTYVVTATDSAQNSTSSSVAVLVVAASATAPRSLSALSPTNSVPHLTWQKPTTFAVTQWQITRDSDEVVATLTDPDVVSFDDSHVTGQGPHVYTVRALSGDTAGDASNPITVTYDTVAPVLGEPTAVAVPSGAVALSWPDATDPGPGSGVADYIVRRSGQTSPADVTAGTNICTVTLPAATGCVDSATNNATTYNYSVFAVDGAGNVARQIVSARAVDTVAPDPVTGFQASVGPTNAHLVWDAPARQGNDADLAGYRILKLADGVKQPTNPRDGSEACPGLGFRANDCFVQNLPTGKKVTFAIYAEDEVPNYSAPTLLTLTPNSSDHTNPGLPTKVRLKRVGATITMTWISPRDRDLSKFRVTLYNNGPAPRPAIGKAVVTGRVLRASFKLKARQIVYVNLFAIDLSGNFSRVTRLIVMPDKLAVPKTRPEKAAKKKAAATPTKSAKTT
jgi:hypothetical protein